MIRRFEFQKCTPIYNKALNEPYFTNDPIFRSFALKRSSTRILGFPAKAREGPREALKGGSGSLHMQGIQDWLDKIQRSCKMLYNIALLRGA